MMDVGVEPCPLGRGGIDHTVVGYDGVGRQTICERILVVKMALSSRRREGALGFCGYRRVEAGNSRAMSSIRGRGRSRGNKRLGRLFFFLHTLILDRSHHTLYHV